MNLGSSRNRVGSFEAFFDPRCVRTGLRSAASGLLVGDSRDLCDVEMWLDFRRHDSDVRWLVNWPPGFPAGA